MAEPAPRMALALEKAVAEAGGPAAVAGTSAAATSTVASEPAVRRGRRGPAGAGAPLHAAGAAARPTKKKKGEEDGEADWVHMGMISVKIIPHEDAWPLANLAGRTMFRYRWRPAPRQVPSGPVQVADISLHDMVNEPVDKIRALHVYAMHHFYVEMATGNPMPQSDLETMFGSYDPWEHKGPGEA